MKDLVVIVPMHDYSKENVELLKKAIDSVPEGIKVVVSSPKELSKKKMKNLGENVTFIYESDGGNFQDLVNVAVNAIDEKWFSILEFDDTYTNAWLSNVENHIEYMPNISVFMVLEDIVNFDDKKYLGFGNAEAWASSFSNELGYIDNECLQNYFDFYLTGSIFNTADWRELGGLKSKMTLTFWYEFLLRATNKGKKVYVIPKVGYVHSLNRKGSLVDEYKTNMTAEEIQFYFDLAKREYFFHPSTERNLDYKETTSDKQGEGMSDE